MAVIRRFAFCAFATLLVRLLVAQTPPAMPRISGESLSGQKIALPEASLGRIAVLIFGFTKSSKEQTSAWQTSLGKDLADQPDVSLYQLPVLEDVPRLIRGMVISSIRKGVPENQRDHFVILVQGEDELKKLVDYKEADDAYLVMLDRQGRIARQTHGAVNAERATELEKQIRELLKK